MDKTLDFSISQYYVWQQLFCMESKFSASWQKGYVDITVSYKLSPFLRRDCIQNKCKAWYFDIHCYYLYGGDGGGQFNSALNDNNSFVVVWAWSKCQTFFNGRVSLTQPRDCTARRSIAYPFTCFSSTLIIDGVVHVSIIKSSVWCVSARQCYIICFTKYEYNRRRKKSRV